jgi:hypothetical protein
MCSSENNRIAEKKLFLGQLFTLNPNFASAFS